LIVKLQYKDFEPGEFTGIKDRTFEETMGVIEAFPWEEQREHFKVGLTCPSVTLESPGGEFLKLAPYYNGKLVLYFIDLGYHEFMHPIASYAEARPVIETFYRQPSTLPDGFARQQTPFRNIGMHFRSKDFTFRMTWVDLFAAGMYICLALLLPLILAIGVFAPRRHAPYAVLLMAVPFLIIVLRMVPLLINHYRAANGRVLILSRGIQEFTYGPVVNPQRFNKSAIREIVTHGVRGRGGYSKMTWVEIIFANGQSLNISCLILKQEMLVAKFPHCQQSEDTMRFPFIPPAASSPS